MVIMGASDKFDKMDIPQEGQDGKVKVGFEDYIAILHMNCGENRMNPIFFRKIHEALNTVLRNSECKALITTGEGRFYSNGIDLNWLFAAVGSDKKLQAEFSTLFNRVIARILTFPMPTVAAVNGHAYAGGAVLALAHDYTVMRTDRGYWCLNEIKNNLRMPSFPLEVIRSKLSSPLILTQAMLHGRQYTGEQARQCGIAYTACEGDKVLPTSIRVAREACGPNGLDRDTLLSMKNDTYINAVKHVNVEDIDKGYNAKL